MKGIFTKLMAALALLLLVASPMMGWGQTEDEAQVLFHETFGDNSGSARDWNDDYSEKSGVEAVYSGITSYVVSNVKQGKNTTGSTQSGLNQSSQGTDAYIVFGPLNVADYSDLSVTYQWKAGSIKGTYSTNLYYATSSTGTYTVVNGTGAGATTFVERSYSLPQACQVSTLYLKVVFNTSNTQAIIDEFELKGVGSGAASTAVATTTTIDATGITNTDVYTSTAAGSLSATVTETESGDEVSGATVTWSSSNEAVATIDENTGVVTLVAAGTVTFTASYAGVTDEYQASSATYVMTVTNNAPSITFTDNESPYTIVDAYHIELPSDASGGYVAHVGYENFQSSLAAGDFQVIFCDVNGNASLSAPAWLEHVRVTLMPEWAQDETLYLEVSAYANTSSEARTAYFKVGAANGTVMVYSDVVTITQAAKSYTATLTQSSLELTGSYTTDTEKTIDGITYVYTDLMKSNERIQAKASSGTIKNATAYPGNITSVAITHDGTARATTIKGSADGTNWIEVKSGSGSITADFSGRGYKYFQITRGDNAAYWTKIEITWEEAPLSTMAEIYAKAEEVETTETPVEIAFNGWIVTAVMEDQNRVFVTDGTKGFVIKEESHGFAVGNTLTGTVNCNLKMAGSFNAEVSGVTASDLTIGSGTPTVAEIPMAELSGINTGALVTFHNLIYQANGKLTDGTNEIHPTTTLCGLYSFIEGTAYDITGIIWGYNGATEILPRSAADIEVSAPSLVVTPTSQNVSSQGDVRDFTVTAINVPAASASYVTFYDPENPETTIDQPTWITIRHGYDPTIYLGYDIVQNDGEARTACFKLFVEIPGNTTPAASEMITITQESQYFIEVSDLTNVRVEVYVNQDYSYDILQGGTRAAVVPGTLFNVKVIPDEGFVLHELMVGGELYYSSDINEQGMLFDDLTMPSENVLITATAFEAPQPVTYSFATSLTPGRHYIIAGFGANNPYIMGEQNDNNRAAVLANDYYDNEEDKFVIPADVEVYEFVISGPEMKGEDMVYTIYDETSSKYLYAASSSSNHLKGQTFNNADGQWTITFDATDDRYNAVIKAQGTNNRNWMMFNSSNSLFSCYASGQYEIYLYQRADETTYTFYHDVAKYTTNSNNWQLIASPVADANVSLATTGNGNYDLYAYDELSHYWLNQKVAENNITAFNVGQGYLYANSANKTLKFEGEANRFSGIQLSYAGDALTGLNLVGNPRPYVNEMWISDGTAAVGNINYLTMNGTGTGFVSGTTGTDGKITVMPLQGFFVQATATGQTLVDGAMRANGNTKSAENTGSITLNLRESQGLLIDNVIVRFGEGRDLAKFMLKENNTKLFMKQHGREYSILRSNNEGEMPVSFKAAENGTYTFSVNVENVEMNYLHLIDNLTGTDIDLLATPNYSFEANTRDYANRFKLVFKANTGVEENTATETFAYFNGSEWVINNNGNATLQVVDMMGRVLSSEQINGNTAVNINQAAGVYMLRLVNGDNVRTQKVVVK